MTVKMIYCDYRYRTFELVSNGNRYVRTYKKVDSNWEVDPEFNPKLSEEENSIVTSAFQKSFDDVVHVPNYMYFFDV